MNKDDTTEVDQRYFVRGGVKGMPDECPKYKIQLAKGRKYCPSCGYEFETAKIGVGPLAFAYPSVESAYKPSGEGSLSSYVLLLVTGLSVGIVMGGLLYPLHTAISSLLWETFLKEEHPFVPLPLKIPALLLVLGYFLVGPFLLGLLVAGWPLSFAVDKAAIIGKNRNVKAVKTIGLVSGLMGFVSCWAIKNTFNIKVLHIVAPGDFTPILVLIEFFLGIMAACLFLAGEGARGSEKRQKTPERKLKTRRKAAYRRIKKYCKSIRQYKKERLRRKLCWLLSGKYKEAEIAKMLGISRRTVIRDMNKIKPYYFRLSRSYFRELERQRILDFNAKLDSAKTLKQRFDILTPEMEVLRKRMKQREYNRHVIKVFIDLDFMKYGGFPRITIWPKGSCEISRPHIFKFYCQKDGQKHEMYPPLVISEVEKRSWW